MSFKKPREYCFYRFLLVFFLPVIGQEIPERPHPPKLVNDYAGVLNQQQRNQLELKLVQFNRETSNQIAIVITKDLHGYDPADYAFRLGEKWGIGQKKFDNGIVILVKPKTSNSRGRAFIATGYGLEGAVPDATASRIVNNEMIPHFKNNNYYQGLLEASKTLISLTKGEYSPEEYRKQTKSKKEKGVPFFFIIIIIAIISSLFGKRRRHSNSIGRGLPLLFLLGMMGGSRQGGSFGDFSSGGGDFGGFGGGGFGGGGAGGSW